MPDPQVPAPLVCQSIGQVYEWAQIYATERQTLLKKIDETPKLPKMNTSSRQTICKLSFTLHRTRFVPRRIAKDLADSKRVIPRN